MTEPLSLRKHGPWKPPPCCYCGREPFRNGHALVAEGKCDNLPDNSKFGVCMHCAQIIKLAPDEKSWLPLTPEEDATVRPDLQPFVRAFMRQIMVTALFAAGPKGGH